MNGKRGSSIFKEGCEIKRVLTLRSSAVDLKVKGPGGPFFYWPEYEMNAEMDSKKRKPKIRGRQVRRQDSGRGAQGQDRHLPHARLQAPYRVLSKKA